ncbi:MAG: hypothetical protein SFW65_05805 [Alphaproteobacteria bacterium]|nr:hypothetical protein [Alphaproteobacteria bacterium]
MSDIMVLTGHEIESRFMSAMRGGIDWVHDTAGTLRNWFSHAADECGARGGSEHARLMTPHPAHAPELHSAAHHDEKAHQSFGGWLDWLANKNKQQSWAVRINEIMRKAGAAFSYHNLPRFFPKRPSTESIHARPFTHGARPEV